MATDGAIEAVGTSAELGRLWFVRVGELRRQKLQFKGEQILRPNGPNIRWYSRAGGSRAAACDGR